MPPAPVAVPVRIIGINDFHGNLESSSLYLSLPDPGAPGKRLRVPAGGAAAMAGIMKTLRAGSPNTIVTSAGDMIGASPLVSTLYRHESTIAIMNTIGVDAHSLGNHEFDAGFAELKRIAGGGCAPNTPDQPAESCADGPYQGATFPFIAANVLDANGNPAIAASVVKRVGGVPIGIIAAVTKTTPILVRPSGIAGLTFADEADSINREVQRLRAQGVKTFIAVFHEGGEIGPADHRAEWNDTRCEGKQGPIFDIAHRLDPDIRVLMTGHTHQGYRCEFEGRLLIQGTSYGRGVSVVDLQVDGSTGKLIPESIRSRNLPVLNEQTPDAIREALAAAEPEPYGRVLRETRVDDAIAARVKVLADAVAPKANRQIGRLEGPFTRGGTTDSTAGRLVADAQLAATKGEGAVVAFMNPGGIRGNFECRPAPCPVTFGQAFTMQPFGNDVMTVTLTGAQVKALLEAQVRPNSSEPTILQPSLGFTYTWKDSAPTGAHVSDMRLAGEPIVAGKSYRVTVNSFLVEGGDGFAMLKDAADRKGGGQDLDALVAYLGAAPTRAPDPTPRMNRQP